MTRATTQRLSKRDAIPHCNPESISLNMVGNRNAIGQSLPSRFSKLLPAMPTSGRSFRNRTSAAMPPGRTCASGLSR